jgi:hypothetical protein
MKGMKNPVSTKSRKDSGVNVGLIEGKYHGEGSKEKDTKRAA